MFLWFIQICQFHPSGLGQGVCWSFCSQIFRAQWWLATTEIRTIDRCASATLKATPEEGIQNTPGPGRQSPATTKASCHSFLCKLPTKSSCLHFQRAADIFVASDNLHEIQFSVSVHKVLREYSHAPSLIYRPWLLSLEERVESLQHKRYGPQSPEMVALGSFAVASPRSCRACSLVCKYRSWEVLLNWPRVCSHRRCCWCYTPQSDEFCLHSLSSTLWAGGPSVGQTLKHSEEHTQCLESIRTNCFIVARYTWHRSYHFHHS